MALARLVVIASTPAAPASSATMNDQRSGCRMKPVCGRGRVTMSAVTSPVRPATRLSSATTTTETTTPDTSTRTARPVRPPRPNTSPVAIAATVPNSGPTTIAPTTSTAESVMTAIAARTVASTKNR